MSEIQSYPICFHEDSIISIKAGLHASVDGQDPGRYPWRYLGTDTYYYVHGDTLSLLDPADSIWRNYAVVPRSDGLWLVSSSHAFRLERTGPKVPKSDLAELPERISLEVFDLKPYEVWYEVEVHANDSLVYRSREFSRAGALPNGFFDRAVSVLKGIDIQQESNENSDSIISDDRSFRLRLYMSNGDVEEYNFTESSATDRLKLALLPVIYSYDLLGRR